ncbi:LuxR family transcriptional regulator [Streptomyces sp. DSM 41527]|uniref:LuxR family transcriptional regulator n=1 Tax=Streptomyces mooreae TaxID=3075523 RepID=A0ABU2TD95_9ACTN|nr:LuxR family transcriptional regulator [Streptomyces sp. DSM 41527]MDT0458894.1 LuxR family transcriptional regulator [Streptomyces sp. DSM 41527]
MVLGEIGRRNETARLRAVLARSRRDRCPVVAVVRGEPGAGKSTLLEAFGADASAAGFRVAVVRGTGAEDRPYSTVNRLIAQLRPDDRQSVEVQHRTPPGDGPGGLTAAVPTEQDAPVALCVDDMAQVDSWSLWWLSELSRTVPTAPLAIVLTARICGAGAEAASSPAYGTPDKPGAVLLSAAEPIDLPGLHTHDLPEAAAARCRVRLDTRTAQVCGELTGGNPALLHALLAPHAGSAPTADAVRATAASGILTGADRWLAPLSASALALTRAVAVLGEGAEVVESAELARLTVEEALGAVDQLVDACLLANRTPLAFRHPLLESMVLGRIAAGTRAALHLRAAALLRERQAATTTVAHHLVAAGLVGQEWAMRCLRRAARQLEQEGRSQDAARCLRAALREPLRPHEKSAVRRELAELDAFVDPERAVRLLDAARCESHDSGVVLEYALALAAVLVECGRAEEAVTVLDDAAARLGRTSGDGAWQLRLRVHKAFTCRRGPLWLAQAADPSGNLNRQTSQRGNVGRELAALRAVQEADAGADRGAAVRHARQGLPRGEGRGSATLLWHTCGVLVAAGEVAEAWTHCGRGRQVAGARPGRWDHIKVELLRATVLRARGDLHAADATLTPLADRLLAFAATGHPSAVAGVAALAEVRVLKGGTESARSLLAESGLDRDPLPWRRDSAHALAARAAVHASDDPARALEDLRSAGRLLEDAGVRNPAVLPWRSRAARLLSARAEREEAAELAGAEVEAARRWGTPESIGTALHALARTENGERRIDLLTEAAGLLARSPDRLHHAFVQADLGAGLAELGRGEAACAALLSAFRLARACGAEPLARHVQGVWGSLWGTGRGPLELSGIATSTAAPDPASVREPSVPPASAVHASPQSDAQSDAQPPQPDPQPASPLLDRLTPQERKILHLAKEGHSNRDIAGRLFVAVRTVEFHLSGAYRKLGITGRRQLAQVFSGG